jgi:hypothetical protein
MKLSLEEFVLRSQEVHGQKYDYSKSKYENFHEKVNIICLIHGEFKQRAKHHINGSGCRKCSAKEMGNIYLDRAWPIEQIEILKANKELSIRKLSALLNKDKKTVSKMLKTLGVNKGKVSKSYKDIDGKQWVSMIGGARNRGIEFNITQEQVWELFLKQNAKCALTGWSISFKGGRKRTASIDRIDSKEGYRVDNIQIVHKTINRLKMAFDEEFLFQAARAIFIHNKNRFPMRKLVWEPNHWLDTEFPKEVSLNELEFSELNEKINIDDIQFPE